jgi:diaminopropionate ammonia-lyase
MSRLLVNHRTAPLAADSAPGPEVLAFHRRLAGYGPTALVELPDVAKEAGVGRVLVKAETERFGLPAFKALGASWATYRVLCERLGGEPVWSTWAELADAVASELVALRLLAATDGNHGRAVAWVARNLGLAATIFVPEGMALARIDAIASEGAEVRVVDGTYDDAVAASAAEASPLDLVISDTSWPGYEDPPRWVIEGYSTIFAELDEQLDAFGGWSSIDIVVVPLGVGAFGAAAATHLRAGREPGDGPFLLGVEPDTAACCLAAIEAGHVVEVPGPHRSIMAGLNCGLASMLALPVITAGFDAVVTIDDDRCRDAIRSMAAAGLDVGERGAAGLGALVELGASHGGVVPIPSGATALVLATEAVTDPALFEQIVGRPPHPSGFRP